MSYCRTSCPDGSDVYVFGSGKLLECWVAWREADAAGIDSTFMVPMDSVAPEKTMVGHLMWLRSKGLRVPDHGVDRLLSEIGEEPS